MNIKYVINSLKTKSMKIGRQNEVLNIQTSERPIEQVEEFKYLGVTFTSQGETTKAIQERITLGQRAYGRLKRVWNDRHISQELKIRLLKAIVIPTTLYGAETWIIRKREEQKLTAFENRCLRRICGITWQDRISNEEIREATNTKQTIIDIIHDIQRRWYGHVQRMERNRWPKMLLNGWVAGNRPRGRPRTSWLKKFQEANEQRSAYQLETMARNRMEWRRWRHQMGTQPGSIWTGLKSSNSIVSHLSKLPISTSFYTRCPLPQSRKSHGSTAVTLRKVLKFMPVLRKAQ